MENGERGTGNGERGTGNGERGTGNGERGTEKCSNNCGYCRVSTTFEFCTDALAQRARSKGTRNPQGHHVASLPLLNFEF